MRVVRSSVVFLFFLFGAILFPAIAMAAQDSSAIVVRGTVLDDLRAPIAGAHVTATPDGQSSSGSTVSAVTNTNGAFTLSLPAGRFVIHVTADGFRDGTQNLVTAATGAAPLQFVLQVAAVREDVTVTAPSGYQVPA